MWMSSRRTFGLGGGTGGENRRRSIVSVSNVGIMVGSEGGAEFIPSRQKPILRRVGKRIRELFQSIERQFGVRPPPPDPIVKIRRVLGEIGRLCACQWNTIQRMELGREAGSRPYVGRIKRSLRTGQDGLVAIPEFDIRRPKDFALPLNVRQTALPEPWQPRPLLNFPRLGGDALQPEDSHQGVAGSDVGPKRFFGPERCLTDDW